MSKESKAKAVEEIFQKTPIDQYFEENKEKLPKDMLPQEKQKILNDSKFFGELGVTTDTPEEYVQMLKKHRAKRKALKGINKDMPDNKVSKAYPNYDEYIFVQPQRNTTKWLEAVKDMYYRVHKGSSKVQALENVIAGWDQMEKLDFKNWLRFYEENAHKKYSEASDKPIQIKVGQVGYWEDVNRAGYFVPIHKDPEPVGRSIDFAKDPETNEGIKADDKREVIEAQRNKIVSRLDSAEKLLRSHEGQIFAGKDFEALMHIIYELKKKIHTVNKISVSTKLYEDMIVREANIQTRRGFKKGAELLFKIAEDKPLAATPAASPASGGGLPGSATAPGPADPSPQNNTPPNPVPAPPGPGAPPPAPDAKPSAGMKGFLKGLEGTDDIQLDDDGDIQVQEDDSDAWIVEAQAAPDAPAEAPAPAAPAPDENLEVTEGPTKSQDPEVAAGSDFDKKFEQMFQGVTVEDVIEKLEDLTKIYKTREIPRQLAMVDMMLDRLGLASFFPTLAEATNKALDSNQYILTRLEDITSRLRGTVQTNEIDLKSQNPAPSSPELQATRNKLQEEQDKEKERKQMKKEQENAQVAQQGKPEPELEVQEDLGGPVEAPAAPPAPAPAPTSPPGAAPVR